MFPFGQLIKRGNASMHVQKTTWHYSIRPLEEVSEQCESEENPMPMNNEEAGDWPAPTEAKAKSSFSTDL